MSAWISTITNKGIALNNKLVTGEKITLTRAQSGSNFIPITDLKEQTQFFKPVQDISLHPPVKQSDGTFMFIAIVDNIGLEDGYSLYQVGIFANDPDDGEILYAIAQADVAEKVPSEAEGPGYCIEWNFTIQNSNEADYKITLGYRDYVTVEDLNGRLPVVTTASGTGAALSVETDKDTIKDGQQLTITLTEDLSAGATLSCDGGKAYPIYNSNGTEITEGQQKAGSTLNVIFNEEKQCWYVLGGGSVEIATEAEAKAGTDNLKMMTPLRVANYVDKVLGDVNTILDEINGEVI